MTAVGELIGSRYRLLQLIGQGGMGRVWRGTDETLGRDVAVKELLLPEGVAPGERTELVQRVLREARSAARLNHPGIITVHDVVEHQGAPVIVMEYVTGSSLAAAVRAAEGLPVARVAEIGAAMVRALQQAHAAGIVHRDLKPDNVLLMGDRVIITDFGIAHVSDTTTELTGTGVAIGTPAYMSPEQLDGRPPTPANDLWSLGATLYTAVEGTAPFEATSFGALCVAVVTKEPRPPQRAGSLTPVLARLLAKDPAQRLTADQALAALEAVARGEAAGALPPQPTPTRIAEPAAPAAPPPPSYAPAPTGYAPVPTGYGPTPAGYGPAPAYAPTPGQVPAPSHAPAPVSHGPAPTGYGSAPAGYPAPAYPPGPYPASPVAVFAQSTPAAAIGAQPQPSAAGPALARTVRFVGCMALFWIVGAGLPWNHWGELSSQFVPMLVVFTVALSVLQSMPRPRAHPAVMLPIFLATDAALYVLAKILVYVLLGSDTVGTDWFSRPILGLGEAPWQLAANLLILATGGWLLWWWTPGSRPR
ncbi:protein kinase domain-containing protein [Kitasatospora sp. LaBMicrA B282]|uniref:serine/threonine-protein kinase n=1 Tax=Kitasatospora sp. LaBMicrA B282 TaxID=3420949 RepID=UPI003D0FA9D3